jgi:hypothetical protein
LPALKARVQKNTIILVCAYGALFIWAVIHTTYRDHMDLTANAQRNHKLFQGEQSKELACSSKLDKDGVTITEKQDLIDTLQEAFVAAQGPQQQQAASISSCITNLAKMNPIIRLKISVVMAPFATMDVQGHIDPKQATVKKQVTELFIITNVEQQNFRGVLECARPFTISAGPFIDSESRFFSNGTPEQIPKSDRAYEIRVEQTNTVWNSSHPAYLRVMSEVPNPGGCKFMQSE